MSNEQWNERERLLQKQASEWYWKLQDSNLSKREQEDWQRWQAVPEHRAAFDTLSSDWNRWREMPWPWRSEARATQTRAARVARPGFVSCGRMAVAVDARASMVREQAAYWYLSCLDDPSLHRSDRREFLAWMRRSPENIVELFKIAQLDGELRRLKLTQRSAGLDRSNVIELATSGAPNELHRYSTAAPPGRTFARTISAAAAAVLVSIGIAFFAGSNTHNRTIATSAGDLRHTTLEDGTVLHIDARTRLEIEFTSAQRLVHLYEGSAVFEVAKDAKRPFVARTRLGDITAVGTRFGVSIEQGVRTTVAEGRVKVSARNDDSAGQVLRAGEELLLPDNDLAKPVVSKVDAERKLEWTNGWLVFKGETVGEAVAQFNRRNAVQIQVEPSDITARIKVYGRFRLDSPSSFANFVGGSESLFVVADLSANTIRLHSKAPEETTP